jgi:hypothetical protein
MKTAAQTAATSNAKHVLAFLHSVEAVYSTHRAAKLACDASKRQTPKVPAADVPTVGLPMRATISRAGYSVQKI